MPEWAYLFFIHEQTACRLYRTGRSSSLRNPMLRQPEGQTKNKRNRGTTATIQRHEFHKSTINDSDIRLLPKTALFQPLQTLLPVVENLFTPSCNGLRTLPYALIEIRLTSVAIPMLSYPIVIPATLFARPLRGNL